MKTMKNYGVCAVLAAALLAMALVVSCGPDLGSNGGYVPSAGMGAVKLSPAFDHTLTRTVTLAPGTSITDFLSFKVEFTPTSASADGFYVYSDFSTPFEIEPATYTSVKIYGYLDAPVPPVPGPASDPTELAAYGEWTGSLNIATGQTSAGPVAVVLGPIADGVGTGTFAWDIDATEIVSELSTTIPPTMTVTEIGGAVVAALNGFDLSSDWAGSEDINSGFYYVDFVLTLSDDTTEKTFRHVLQVYQSRTSTFEYEFTKNHLGIKSTSVGISAPTYVVPGQYPPTFVLSGAGTGTGLSAATPRVITTAQTVTVTISNAANPSGAGTPVPYTGIEWHAAGVDLTTNATNGAAVNDVLVIDRSFAPFNNAAADTGAIQLSVIAVFGKTQGGDDVYHSAEIFIEIVTP